MLGTNKLTSLLKASAGLRRSNLGAHGRPGCPPGLLGGSCSVRISSLVGWQSLEYFCPYPSCQRLPAPPEHGAGQTYLCNRRLFSQGLAAGFHGNSHLSFAMGLSHQSAFPKVLGEDGRVLQSSSHDVRLAQQRQG